MSRTPARPFIVIVLLLGWFIAPALLLAGEYDDHYETSPSDPPMFSSAKPADAQVVGLADAAPAAPYTNVPGVRHWLEARGIVIDGGATTDLSVVQSSVLGRHRVARSLLQASAAVDLGRLGFNRTSAMVQVMTKRGADLSYANDNQGFSNIDADDFFRVGELWLEQKLPIEGLRLKAGRIDANTELAGVEAASEFMNSSMGFSPTIMLFPTYPNPRPGFVLAFDGSRGGTTFAAFRTMGDGDFDADDVPNTFYAGEVRGQWQLGSAPGHVKFGYWQIEGILERLDAGDEGHRTAGTYATLEQRIWSGRDGSNSTVDVFLQYGEASPYFSENDRHVGGGLLWRAPLEARRGDALGVGLTLVHLSSEAIERTEDGTETSVGLFYRVQAAPWLAIQPDVQYVVHPAGIAPFHSSVLTSCRLIVTY